MLRDILVPVDGSESAARAARWGAFLADATGAKLTFLFVYDAGAVASVGLTALSKEQLEAAKKAVSRGAFEHATEQSKEFDVDKSFEVTVGHPANEIVDWAKQHHPQLIVMGTRGLSPLRQVMMGSVSDYIAHHAPCPVTLVR